MVRTIAAAAVICVATVAAIAEPRAPQEPAVPAPRRRRWILAWFLVILAGAIVVGAVIQSLIPLLMHAIGGESFEWTIFLGTLIGGLGMVTGLAGAIVQRATRREIVLLIAQVLGVWVVCIGTLMQIRG